MMAGMARLLSGSFNCASPPSTIERPIADDHTEPQARPDSRSVDGGDFGDFDRDGDLEIVMDAAFTDRGPVTTQPSGVPT